MKYYPFLKVYRTLDNYKKIIIIFLYNYIIFFNDILFFNYFISYSLSSYKNVYNKE